ncbi:hypothetical protein SPBR_04710 [Sporothrix brasiliensis 5110]|uniref:Zn(2)-C6 fungal-type domain-containing protein n=1 Tax=Sporothrix brasiliensis 5110 TaxID=1398154 RepID=A0A0C2IF11_9PEZI|nr:uncharacterized protein SPBR_04710 [Sporothrix brasiliensis 5110]KIH87806.1 hypothetical protein SPBR_04710 [Sporothrix brasiliensis 5110]
MSAPDRARRRRQSKACTRCRKRKIRCDFNFPACGACVSASAPCVGFDSIHGVEKPRSVISHLEEEVERLEKQLQETKRDQDAALPGDQTADRAAQAKEVVDRMTTRLATATVSPVSPVTATASMPMLPLTSSVFFVGSPAPHLHKSTAWDETRGPAATLTAAAPLMSPSPSSTSSAVPISSIPRHVAVIMLKHYCEIYRPQYPAVEEQDLLQAFDRVYDKSPAKGAATDFDVFCVHITLAISTTTLMYRDAGRAATATAGFWATAVAHLDALDRDSNATTQPWQRVQALQLLAHYGFLNPKDVDCVRCTAAALRLCVQLGLHHELPREDRQHVSPAQLDIRRRLFWHSLSLDLAANSTRSRPGSMAADAFTAKMPALGATSPTAHIWALRQMEGEILSRLYYSGWSSSSSDDLDTWHADIRARLSAWHQATRQSVALAETLEFADILFHMQRLRLSRPSPRRPCLSPALQSECLAASVAVLRAFDVIARLGKLFYIWHAAHCVVEAAIYTGVVKKDDVPILTRHLKTFPGNLWKVARRWPAITHHAAALEAISQAVVDRLQRQWVTHTTPEADMAETVAALKQKLKDMSLFSPFPEDATTAALEAITDTPPLSASTSASTSTDVNMTAPFDANWALPPLSPGQMLPVQSLSTASVSSNTAVDPGSNAATMDDDSILDWDFAGVGFEEIFAALIQANQTEDGEAAATTTTTMTTSAEPNDMLT